MSRVDEARSEKRAEEARLAERRVKEQLQKQRGTEASAFDRTLAQKSTESGARAHREFGGRAAANSETASREQTAAQADSLFAADAPESESRAERGQQSAQSQRAFSKKLSEGARQPPPSQAQGRPAAGAETGGRLAGLKQPDVHSSDAKKAEGGLDAKSEQFLMESSTGAAGGRKKGSVGRAGGEDSGSSGKESGGSSKETGTGNAFRLPPAALMAPPPLARPREAGGVRAAMMKEVVDKIVSRVLVGTNSKGIPEFRLDLKSNVLKGLSIKVSGGRGGKIRAVFSGSDREVLAALKQSSQDLVDALKARGLTLEELVVEADEDR